MRQKDKNPEFKKKKSYRFRRNIIIGISMLIVCTIAGAFATYG